MSSVTALPGLQPHAYSRHALHAENRIWVEKNCYVDVWIEAVHSLGCEPLAVLPFTAAIDFEGDQWTFYKPPHDELRSLYGIDVQELNVWRPLLDHCIEHLAAGRLISTEADAFWLPDTSGTDYRRVHTKSTIVLAAVDPENQTAHYFHNAGFYELRGEDFVNTFRVGFPYDPEFMPLFAEVVRTDRVVRAGRVELAMESTNLWSKHLARVPKENPVARFSERFALDLPDIQARGINYYHAWAFASTRQLGSAFELAALNLQWLANVLSRNELQVLAEDFLAIATECKSSILKMARTVNSKRAPDLSQLAAIADRWDQAIGGALDAFRA